MPATLFQKIWDAHAVRRLPNGQTQLYMCAHPASPQNAVNRAMSVARRQGRPATLGAVPRPSSFCKVQGVGLPNSREMRGPLGDP